MDVLILLQNLLAFVLRLSLWGGAAFVVACLMARSVRWGTQLNLWRLPRPVLAILLAVGVVAGALSVKTPQETNGVARSGMSARTGLSETGTHTDENASRIKSIVHTTNGVALEFQRRTPFFSDEDTRNLLPAETVTLAASSVYQVGRQGASLSSPAGTLWTFVSGCRPETVVEAPADKPLQPVSAEAQAIQKRVAELRAGLSGKEARRIGHVANRLAWDIRALSEKEQTQIAHLFMTEVDALGETEVEFGRMLVVWLYNYQEILLSTHLCADFLDDKEWCFRQYVACVERYEKAIQKCRDLRSEAPDRETQRRILQLERDFATDCATFCRRIIVFLLEVKGEVKLPANRLLYWKQYFEERANRRFSAQ